MHFLTRRRYKPSAAAVTFVAATPFTFGAESFAPVPTHDNPRVDLLTFPQLTFTPPTAAQPGGLLNQGLALPNSPLEGVLYNGIAEQSLIDPANYPILYPGLQQGRG